LVEIFSTFISIQPEKVPRTPYLSAFIALQLLAVTKPMNSFRARNKDSKKTPFSLFSESNFSFFVTFDFKKIDNENYHNVNGIRAAISKALLNGCNKQIQMLFAFRK
jgi:hypothetical protein